MRIALAVGLLALATSLGAQERPAGPVHEDGEIAGAAFLIDIPAGWNGGLLMYAHGYAVQGTVPPWNEPMVQAGNALGYAVAQSRYSRQGWAAREGVLDTEALRRYFVDRHGPVYPTLISGHSQGGFITFKTIETYPEVYDGALPMCGSSEPALKFFKERVFDMRLLFDYYFPGLAGSVVEFPDGRETLATVSVKARELVTANPELAQTFVDMVNLPDVESIPGVIGFWSEILRELTERGGGNAFDNRNTVYGGSPDDARLNREIPRFSAAARAVEYLRQWSQIEGTISDPVVALHTTVDQLIPIQSTAYYEQITRRGGTDEHFVQLWVDRKGHCRFNQEEHSEALRRLDTWVREGKRAEPGEITVAESPGR